MAHGHNPMIKREIDCVHHNSISVINKSSSLVGNSATVAATAAAAQPNDGSGATSHSGAGNARTGSRRIFTPQFKLQVLESYRNDSECKLNQRATARKYNIHRRQIQKWLQCEKSLRQSVANNYSQNNVKHHQFHNITHHQMTISPSSTAATAIGAAAPTAAATTTPAPAIAQTATAVSTHTTSGAYAHHNNNNLHYHHHHRHSQPYKTALDPARHSVALASSPPTVRLNAASTKCMNGLPLTQPGAPTNTMGLHPAYSQTPAIKPVPLIQPHHHHQSPLHQHHHQLHRSQNPHSQHENVLMSSACLPESRAHEMLENPPMNVAGSCYENFHRPQAQHPFGYYRGYPGAPIDLSVGPRRPMEPVEEHQKGLIYYRVQPVKSDVKWYQVPETNNNEQKLEVKVELHSPSPCSVPSRPISTEAVDLTCRKRPNHTPDPSSPPEKIPKTGFEVKAEKAPAKPVKLFKPYLPDNGDPDDDKDTKNVIGNEAKDAIIWSIHPEATSLPSPRYDMHSTHSCSSTTDPNFQSPSHQNDPTYTFPLGSPHSTTSSTGSKFQSSPASSLCDRITPPTTAQHPSSPDSITGGVAATTTLHMWCPKGSPVSGYDTASNYSDSSERHPHPQLHHQHHQSTAYDQCSVSSPTSATGHATSPIASTAVAAGRIANGYSLDVKMEPIEEGGSYYHDLTSGARYPAGRHHSEVQRWLQDHEGNHLDHHPIPHQHNRPGIAVYV